ncbi:MAG: hypothetical protein AAF410_01105, partial [Pseudomonadota bacterium]
MKANTAAALNEEQIIDLPDRPICVGVGEEQLLDADIEIYLADGIKKEGSLKCINSKDNYINYLYSS